MIQPLLITLDKSLLIWIGMTLLLSKKYKWYTFIICVMLTSIFTYYIFLLVNQLISPAIFIFTFTFIISNLKRDGWITEAKINFFYLSVVFMITMLGRAWANLITYWIHLYIGYEDALLTGIYEPSISLLITTVICISVFFFVRKALKKSMISEFIEQIDTDYSKFLVIGTGSILLCYYCVIILPIAFNITGSVLILMQPIYMTLLTFIGYGLMLIFNMLIKKEVILSERNATLADINDQLYNKQKEILKKELLIKSLDSKIMEAGNVQEQLKNFMHGQRELLTALGGVIEFGDKKVIYELLRQYGIKIQEVSKYELVFPDVSQLKTTELMPLRFFLLSKADDAIKQKINFTTEISTEISEIGMPVLDVIDILGIWLNNAIEEAVHTEEKWIHTSFILDEDPGGLKILEVRVTNSCRENTLNPVLANQLGVSTKGTGRGHGLPIVEGLMMKHENIYVKSKVTDGKFMQLLQIVLDAPKIKNDNE